MRKHGLLSNNEVMTIGVIGSDNAQSAKVLSVIESYTDQESNTYCYYADPDEVEQAHEMGLSYGKYRAFLKLKTLDSTITAETIKNPEVTAPATGLDMSRETDVARVDQRDSQDDRRLTFFRMGNEEERAKSGYSPHLPAGCR